MAFGAIAGIAGGVLGAIAGAQGSTSRENQTSVSSVGLRDINDLNKGRSQLEQTTDAASLQQFQQLQQMLNAGPGQNEVTAGLQAQNDFAGLIQQSLQNGGFANASQVGQAQNYAAQIFDPQRVALQQQFQDQNVQGARLAARLGRSGADPILQAKLAQEQTRQMTLLNSQQGAFAAQEAQGAQQRHLQLGEALANVRGGLASQAFANRQTLMTMGQQLTAAERQYRLETATRTNATSGSSKSGGGIAGAISGGLAGFGQFAGASGNIGSLFGSYGSSGGTSTGNNGYAGGSTGAPPR